MTEEPNQLLNRGRAAFRAGNLEQAETLLNEVIARHPRTVVAHVLLSNIARNRNDVPAAEQHARQAVEANPMEPGAHDALIGVLLLSQDPEALLEEYRQAVVAWPDDFGAIYGLGVLLFAAKQWVESAKWLRRAMALAPESGAVGLKTTRALYNGGKYIEALTIITELRRKDQDNAALHELAGRALLEVKQPEKAAKAFRRALDKNPDEHSYHAGLSAALRRAGRLEDAVEVTKDFLKRVPAYTQAAKNPEVRVLVIGSVGMQDCYTEPAAGRKQMLVTGNSMAQLPNDRNTYHFAHIQHPDLLAAAKSLGPIDVVYDNIAGAEASIKKGRGLAIRDLVDKLGVPVVNAPEAIERTTRANNARIIPENTDIIFPRTVLFDLSAEGPEEVKRQIVETVRFPMLIRRTYTNNDMDVAFAADEAALTEALNYYRNMDSEEIYAIEFLTEEFRPGIYRKIRCAIIDKAVYPVRVDFSANWKVHRKPPDVALIKANQDLMDSEQAFLRDPVSYLGRENIARLEALGRLHDLDFLGVDFNIIGDGEMVIFEANSAMNCIEERRIGDFPYFADYWERVLVAFEDMIVKKAGKR